jgi:ATP-dependent DNA helicase RecG
MSTSPLQSRLDAVIKPLAFAAADDFAHLDRVRDLDGSVAGACRRLLESPVPGPLREVATALAEKFEAAVAASGDDDPDALRTRVGHALSVLAPWREPDWPNRELASPLSVFPGVGPRRAESLARRGLSRVDQLLFHLPTGYDDRRALVEVGDLEVGSRATFIAEVQSTGTATARSRGGRIGRVVEAVVGDSTGSVSLKWFHGGEALEKSLKKGCRILVTGDVRRHRFTKQLVHPEVELIDELEADEAEQKLASRLAGLRRVVPRYPTPEGIPARTLRGLVERAVEEYADLAIGYLPGALVTEHGLPDPGEALRIVHAPPFEANLADYEGFASLAHKRLVLEELYLLELGLALRHAEGARLPGIALNVESDRVRALASALPFELTSAQARSWNEIRSDLARPHPMNRLVQGDVGSGKTAVAFLAAAAAAANGMQAALMAPTELLAEQHAQSLQGLVESSSAALGLRIALLTASLPKPEADGVRAGLAAGEIDLVIGTHALVQKDVSFARLAVVVVDEQHRFGVLQRQALAAKREDGRHPHTLVMTATPIPRTLALTLYGDLDASVIDELPPGRSPVKTLLMRSGEGAAVSQLVGETVDRGEQVYVVYPLVEESERVDLRSAIESAERIARAFPACRVDLVHGRLEAEDRRAAMRRFRRGETQILVSTTVIEVGVDVPRATLMVVEHAERFGLAQLHQLRGRVGRGERPGTCVLVSRASRSRKGAEGADPDPDRPADRGEERLKAMLDTTDGFEIANADLRIRGPGEFLGTRQSGHLPDLRVADLLRDQRLLGIARTAAFEAVRGDPGLEKSPDLRDAVAARWGERLALIGVG